MADIKGRGDYFLRDFPTAGVPASGPPNEPDKADGLAFVQAAHDENEARKAVEATHTTQIAALFADADPDLAPLAEIVASLQASDDIQLSCTVQRIPDNPGGVFMLVCSGAPDQTGLGYSGTKSYWLRINAAFANNAPTKINIDGNGALPIGDVGFVPLPIQAFAGTGLVEDQLVKYSVAETKFFMPHWSRLDQVVSTSRSIIVLQQTNEDSNTDIVVQTALPGSLFIPPVVVPDPTDPPAVPVAIAASSVYNTQFQANWNAAEDAQSYAIDVSVSNVFASYVAGFENLNVGNATSATITGLTASTTYYYRVRAVNVIATSANSNVITQATNATAPPVASDPDPVGEQAPRVNTLYLLRPFGPNGTAPTIKFPGLDDPFPIVERNGDVVAGGRWTTNDFIMFIFDSTGDGTFVVVFVTDTVLRQRLDVTDLAVQELQGVLAQIEARLVALEP